jgi:hypothetical protein
MKLQSTTNFVLEQNIRHSGEYTGIEAENLLATLYSNIVRHANFLKQPLTLSMFVPCDDDGNVLEKPNHLDYKAKNNFNELVFISQPKQNQYHSDYDKYQKAKELCLFEGCIAEKKGIHYFIMKEDALPVWVSWNESKTIEDLVPNNLNLTQTAVKQLNL